MTSLNDAHLGSTSIFLQSDKASTSISDAHKQFNLKNIIEVPPNINIMIGLESFECPFSFYNVNQFNNHFEISANGNSVNFNLVSKNYTAIELATQITGELAVSSRVTSLGQTITCTFNDQTNKFLFSSNANSTQYTITDRTTMSKLLGLNLPSSSGLGLLISNNLCNLSGTPCIYFQVRNLGISNLDSRGALSGVIGKININCNFAEFIFYEQKESIYYNITNRSISSLDVLLTDSDNNEIQLNGTTFSCTLNVHFSRIKENIIPEKYLLQLLKEKKKNNENDELDDKN